jgi:HPt (histidine-containing phosphotransfer) domain-containing protein
MNTYRSLGVACLVLWLAALIARGEDSGVVPASLLNEDVVAISVLDATKLSPQALGEMMQIMTGDPELAKEPSDEYRAWHEAFVKHGGERVAAVMTLPAGQPQPPEPVLLFKLKPGADRDAAKAWLTRYYRQGMTVADYEGDWLQAHGQRGRALPPGTPVDEARQALFTAAMGKKGDAPLWSALVPNQAMRDMAAQFQPMMPPELGALVNQLANAQWASLSATAGNAPTASAVAHHADEAAATATKDALAAAAQFAKATAAQMKQDPRNADTWAGMMVLAGLTDQIQPQVQGADVVIALDTAKIRTLATTLAPAMRQARQAARQTQSMSNLRQIGIAIHMYAQDNGNAFPKSFDDLAKYLGGGADQVLKNPATGEKPGYILEPPADKLTDVKNASTTAMAREAKGGKADPNGAVLYVDGHVSRPAPAPTPQ